jgi:hypothetical protein
MRRIGEANGQLRVRERRVRERSGRGRKKTTTRELAHAKHVGL